MEDDIKLEGIFCSINDKEKEKLNKTRNEFLDAFNNTLVDDYDKREELIKKYFGSVGLKPNVSIYTAGSIGSSDFDKVEYGVNIGSDVWIGKNTVINPGVSIGSNVVIGSCSVVVSDIPSNCIAGGNPCRVLRELNENDTKYWLEQLKVTENN